MGWPPILKDTQFKNLKMEDSWPPEGPRFGSSLPMLRIDGEILSSIPHESYAFIDSFDNPPNYKYLQGSLLEAANSEDAWPDLKQRLQQSYQMRVKAPRPP